ncbi:MAG: Glycosyl transferase family 2 [Candidatus Argoarchaeum ethanivorans]|uniref:Glycosyl transferase family 2 n=1 Tax=Candidatus Argoarchaeum ethanivorans TaxID=2608793 RepID=A0A811T6J7_9EURY|nr:MAG: Glycosyl transferase family 2 [Candidatus Argoarchaeum ethanivorans]
MINSNNKQPLVSICIPTYNVEKTIAETLNSIIDQTYKNLEIVISENASTDNTLSLLDKFNDPRIKIYRTSKTIIAEQNFSRCIELATGDYIAIFHADDLYNPDMVEKQVQAFQDNSSVGAVFTMADHIDIHGEIIGEHKLPLELKGKQIYPFQDILTSILKNGNFLLCPSAMVRSKIYKQLSTFDVERFGTSSDLDMWLRILKKHPITILDEKLMRYRISNMQGGTIYNYLRIDEADFFKVIDFHLLAETRTNIKTLTSSLNNYEFQRSDDNIQRAVNYILRGQSQNAKKLLKESFSKKVFWVAMSHFKKPKLLAVLVFGLMLLSSTYLGVELYICRYYHKYRCRNSANYHNPT